MITSSKLCECGAPATRSVPDRWPTSSGVTLLLHLCDHCPTPDEIDAGAARVREGWSDEMHYQKAWDCNVAGVAHRLAYDFRDCLVHVGSMDGRVDRREPE